MDYRNRQQKKGNEVLNIPSSELKMEGNAKHVQDTFNVAC